jgi:predicted nucleotidyltransferase
MRANIPIDVPEQELSRLCRRRRITHLWLFGSVLRDDFAAASDVDVLVRFDPAAALSALDFVAIQDELTELFGRSVDLVEEGALTNPLRRKEILRTRQELYAA